jgi:hypothetical protein
MEAVRVHDIIEEIGERRAEPTVEVSNKEVISVRSAFGTRTWNHASCGVSLRLLRPHALVPVLQGSRIERRSKDGELLPHLHQLALRDIGLCLLALAFASFGRHGGCEDGGRGWSGGGGGRRVRRSLVLGSREGRQWRIPDWKRGGG